MLVYLEAHNLYGYSISTLLPTSEFEWTDSKDFNLNKYNNSSDGGFLEVDFEYQKEWCQLHNDYPLAPDKTQIKKKMMCKYQLLIADF